MNNEKWKFTDGKFIKSLIVIIGIVFGQAVLYGPSLLGQKILLPLDILAHPGVYIPPMPATEGIKMHNTFLSDLIGQFELDRRFAISELHHGRFPLWAPYQYGGVPFVWAKFSPFLLLEFCTGSPLILPWAQLFAALVAGIGMFFFCRKSLRVSFWPAVVCAWGYPLTAFFVLWQGFPTGLAVYWLPWLFLAVDKTIGGKPLWAPLGLSIVTFFVLISGDVDVAGQALLGSGMYAIWSLWNTYRGEWFRRKSQWAVATLVIGWGLGFMLAAPHLLPLMEYAKTGSRMVERSAGKEERPPVGIAALPQVVLPNIYGTPENGSVFIAPPPEESLAESATAAYTGVLATLLVAPLAWCSRRHYAMNWFWLFLAFFGLSWCLNVPGFVEVLRLPGLNMMSHNRLVFLTSFAILSLTAVGLESLWNGLIQRRWWFWLPATLLAGLGGWCVYRSLILPEPIATRLVLFVSSGNSVGQIRDIGDVWQIQNWFTVHFMAMAVFCLLGFAGWLLVWLQGIQRVHWFPALAIVLIGDLLCFGYGRSAQCDPTLYYPNIPVLSQIAASVPGRVIGVNCLAAPMVMMQGLRDIRGYDSVDPARMVQLLETTAEPGPHRPYAAVMFLRPKAVITPPSTIQLPPTLDMLNVRYLVFQGTPPPEIHPAFQGSGYWAMVNSNALRRVFIPKSVETVSNRRDELEKLASPQFNPAAVVYVESPVKLPALCRGVAQITNEIPTHIMVSVQMETPGLVVLADNWDKGWRAYWNGKPMPVLRVNYAIRGVVVPAGSGTLEFVYQPMSLILGLWLAGLAAVVLLVWLTGIKMLEH